MFIPSAVVLGRCLGYVDSALEHGFILAGEVSAELIHSLLLFFYMRHTRYLSYPSAFCYVEMHQHSWHTEAALTVGIPTSRATRMYLILSKPQVIYHSSTEWTPAVGV